MSQNININETPGLFMPTVYCSQYDVGRTIKFKVTSSEGYDIPSGATVKMEGTKPSGLGFTLNGTVSGNEVTFVSTDGETECFTDEAGIFAAELSILSGTDVIGTANFYIEVEPSPHPTGTTDGKAETVIPIFTQLVERIEAAAADVDEKYPDILDAKTDAEAARDAAGQSARDAAQSATDANGYATAAEAAQAEAEQSAADAERYAQSVNPDNLAHRTGTYDGLTAGISKAVIDVNDYIEDFEPYLFRAMPEGTGKVEKTELVGGTVAWNQLFGHNTLLGGSNDGITVTVDDTNKSITVTGTATADTQYTFYTFGGNNDGFIKDHIYYLAQPSGASASTYFIRTGESTFWSYKNIGKMVDDSSYPNIRVCVMNGQTVNFTFKPQFFDLTAMFGSTIADYIYSLEQATAGAGVAFFQKYFGSGYVPYNAGELASVNPTGHKTVGFNQWDEEWEVGIIDADTGQPTSSSTRIRSKNFCKCLPSTDYRFTAPANGVIFWYDTNQNYISYVVGNNAVYTSPSNAGYFKVCMGDIYGNIYKNDICINLHWDGERDGDYEQYEEHYYPIDPSELNGVFKLVNGQLVADGDIRKADGSTQRRFGKRAYQSGDESLTDAITDGTNTVYKLTTQTTEQLTPFEEYQLCDPYGTEEFETTNGVPVGNNTKLFADVIGNLEKRIEALENA